MMLTKTERLSHTSGTAAIMGKTHYWRATEQWTYGEGASGYGDTKAKAKADLVRITAWRRT